MRFMLSGLIVLLATGFSAPTTWAQSPHASRTQSARAKTPPFKPDRLRTAFRRIDEAARLAGPPVAAAHVDDNRLPDALFESIQFNLQKQRVRRSVLEAVRLYSRLEPPRLKQSQLKLADPESQDVSVAVVAATELARRGVPEVFETLSGLAERPEFNKSFGMRRAVVDAVAQYPERRAVAFLIDTLERHDGQLRYTAARHLKRITGENFGGFAGDWKVWWSRNASRFQPAAPAESGGTADDIPWPEAVPKFFGQSVYGMRVLFVIDRSGSMLSTADGVTRIEVVQEELEQVIDSLTDGACFNIVAYEEDRRWWGSKLVEVDDAARSDAVRFVYSLLPQNKTAMYDALEEALRHDENIEQIVLLSDGKPTAGKVIHPQMIVELISAQNAFTQTSINVVGIDTHGEERIFLERLTGRNFGELRVIR